MIGPGITHIPVKAWTYQSNGVVAWTAAEVEQYIREVNEVFGANNVAIRFYLNSCTLEVRPTYFDIDALGAYTMFSANLQTGALNIHFVNTIAGTTEGIANPPFSSPAYCCAIERTAAARILVHELGHTLGLLHTHKPSCGGSAAGNENCGNCTQESVSRSRTQGFPCTPFGKKKCEENADGLCDTQADPRLYTNDVNLTNCTYIGLGTDNWGDTWAPNVQNIMSNAGAACLTQFSPLQIAAMYYWVPSFGTINVPYSIVGPTYVCPNATYSYSLNTTPPGPASFNWTVPAGWTITLGQGGTQIQVTTSSNTGGTVSAMPNCSQPQATLGVSPIYNATDIQGSNSVCKGSTMPYYAGSVVGATYNWSFYFGSATITQGQGTSNVSVYFPPNVSSVGLQVQITTPVCTSSRWEYISVNSCAVSSSPNTNPSQPSEGTTVDLSAFEDGVVVYPNPAVDFLKVHFPNPSQRTIELYAISGQKVLEMTVNEQEVELSTVGLPKGLYLLKTSTGNQSPSHLTKLIIGQ